MSAIPFAPSVDELRIDDNLIPYLELTGWKPAADSNERWYVYQGPPDSEGEALEVVLPRNENANDLPLYLKNAIGLLAALRDESPQATLRRILKFDSDVLYTRNLDTGNYNSIALKFAAQQVSELRQLVSYSACSEQEPKPHFLSPDRAAAQQMINHYRFGHTFSGSFGYTIESRIIRMPREYAQQSFLAEDAESGGPVSIMPIERRVMERIVRGLAAVQRATRAGNSELLIEDYPSGFNSNMCSAIVRMSIGKMVPLEYSVQWSPKLAPAEDIKAVDAIRLSETSYEYLEHAAHELRERAPEIVTVRGRVTSLTSKENPLGLTSRRLVIIRGRYREGGRPIDLLVELDKDDYVAANTAHINWDTVEVSGTIGRIGNAWRLSEPSGFKVIKY